MLLVDFQSFWIHLRELFRKFCSELAEDFVAGIPDERSSFAEAVTTSSALLLFQFREYYVQS